MTIQLHPATNRGTADHGWLQANFSFSFGSYFNPDKVQFGMLRVLNDDVVAAGAGFGTHPHNNMEIITIPLEGSLQHKDSIGNQGVIATGEIQVMSAGTGILHSEMNASSTQRAKTLQIWVLPELGNIEPRYDQKMFDFEASRNELVTVVSPHNKISGNSLWVYQQTWFNLGVFDEGISCTYQLNSHLHGVYVFVIEGSVEIEGKLLDSRDAAGILETESIDFKTTSATKILLIEVPMNA